jgi:predicted small metal-binding protein
MKSMSCADLGGMDCNFKAKGQTADEVKQALFATRNRRTRTCSSP